MATTYEERLYDSQLEPPPEKEEPVVTCPVCGAVLDDDDDRLYWSIDGPSYIAGCTRCLKGVQVHD